MKVAFATWNNRIAPVFDVAGEVRLARMEEGRVVWEPSETLQGKSPLGRTLKLADLGVDVLVCGAISRALLHMVEGYGIRVIPFVSGDLPSLARAMERGRLEAGAFAMPGCGPETEENPGNPENDPVRHLKKEGNEKKDG